MQLQMMHAVDSVLSVLAWAVAISGTVMVIAITLQVAKALGSLTSYRNTINGAIKIARALVNRYRLYRQRRRERRRGSTKQQPLD